MEQAPPVDPNGAQAPRPSLWSPGAVLSCAAFVAYAAAATPAHAWLDAGEIAAAGAELGVMHPTGVPGFTHILQLACALPIGTLGFRMALVSAAFAALALLVLARIFERRGGSWGTVVITGVWLGVGLTFSRQARLVEIYAYASFLLAVILDAFDPMGSDGAGRRLIGVGAAVLGVWSFGDMRLAFALPVALGWVLAFRRDRPWARHAPWVVVMASVPVLALALSSVRGPWADWGDPDGIRRLWEHVNASSIREAFGGQILPDRWSPWAHQGARAFERLVEDIGPLGPLSALAGGIAMWREPEDRRYVLGLALLFAAEWIYTVGVNPMGGVDRQTGIPLAMICVVVAGCALARLEGQADRLRYAAAPLVAALLWVSPAWRSATDLAPVRSWGPHAWTRAALAQLPPGSAMLTASDDLAAGWRGAQSLEGARPDVRAYPAQHLYRPVPDVVARTYPEFAAALSAAYAGCSEADRANAFARTYPGPLYVEDPGLDMVRTLPADLGTPLPLGRVYRAEAPAKELSGSRMRAVVNLGLRDALRDSDQPEDLRRAARAVSSRVRAWLGGRADDPAAVQAAIAAYREVIERTGVELPGTLVSLGALVDRQGHSHDAIALTQRALELEPGRRLALMNLALFLSRDPTQAAEAIASAREAVDLYPQHPAAWRRLAQVCRALADEACVREAQAGQRSAQAVRSAQARLHPSCRDL